MHGRNRRAGSTLVRILAGLAIVAVLGVLAVPGNWQGAKRYREKVIVQNLVRVEMAKQRYALDYELIQGDEVTMAQLLDHGAVLTEPLEFPLEGTLRVGAIGEAPRYIAGDREMTPLNRQRARRYQ